MANPADQIATQLANIEAATGLTVDDFVSKVAEAKLEKHGAIMAFLKADYGMTHGNANLISHQVREQMAGGPPPSEQLLEAQYSKGKAALRPIYTRLAELALACGDDVELVIQKTGVSFRRAKQFALVQAPSAKRVQLGLNLDETPAGDGVEPMSGMCTHRTNIVSLDEVDADVAVWIKAAYERAQ